MATGAFRGIACTLARWAVPSCLAYAAVVAGLGSYPFWRHLSPGRAIVVTAPGCGLAGSVMASVRASDVVRRKVLPVVMASNLVRGAEVGEGEASCAMIAEDLRGNAPWLAAVPRRFLCASVRRHVRSLYLDANLTLGGHILVLDGKAHGTWAYVARFNELGLKWARTDTGFRIVPLAPGEVPPPAERVRAHDLGIRRPDGA